MKTFIALALIINIYSVAAKDILLNKVAAVYNDKIISLAEVQRINKTLSQRKQISAQIFNKKNYSLDQITKKVIESHIIRDALTELGYTIGDDEVESRIISRQKSLGLTKQALVNSLKSYGISYEEYFEVIRETIEFNLFIQRIIFPLINITDQEIKNEFVRRNSKKVSLSFNYEILDYIISKKIIQTVGLQKIKSDIQSYLKKGTTISYMDEIEVQDLGSLNEDGLNPTMKNALKGSSQGGFSNLVDLGGHKHLFYIKNKNLVESNSFLEQKDKIKEFLATKEVSKMKTVWLEREKNKHHIKFY